MNTIQITAIVSIIITLVNVVVPTVGIFGSPLAPPKYETLSRISLIASPKT